MSATSVVGLIGAAGVGKTTLADAVVHINGARYLKHSFGAGIKAMIHGYLNHVDRTGSVLMHKEMVTGDLKDRRLHLFNMATSRELQIAVGQAIRENVDPDFWCKTFVKDATHSIGYGYNVICDDIRQQNEVDTIRSLGGVVIRITGESNINAPDLDFVGLEADLTWPYNNKETPVREAQRFLTFLRDR